MPEVPSEQQPPAALPGDVIQITDKADHWFLALLIVEENRHWGLSAHALMPARDGVAEAPYRIGHGKYQIVGTAALVSGEIAQARKAAVETARLVAEESQRQKETGQ